MKKNGNRISKKNKELIFLLFYRTYYLPGEINIDNSDEYIADVLGLARVTVCHLLWRHLKEKREEHFKKISL